MGINKLIYGGEVKFDLTKDTTAPENLLKGEIGHGRDGEPVVGTCPFDVDSSKANAKAGELLNGRTAGVNGEIITGNMPNNGSVDGKITTKAGAYTVPMGYHDGAGKVAIDPTEQAKLTGGNIKNGVTILGVTGTLTGAESVTAQKKTVTPKTIPQTVLPDEGVDYLSEVAVNEIPYKETPNEAGGTTVTIGEAENA